MSGLKVLTEGKTRNSIKEVVNDKRPILPPPAPKSNSVVLDIKIYINIR